MLKTLRKRKEDTYRSSCSIVGRCLVQLAEETKIIFLLILYISFLYGAEIEVPIVLRANHVRRFDNSGCLTKKKTNMFNGLSRKGPHAMPIQMYSWNYLPMSSEEGKLKRTETHLLH